MECLLAHATAARERSTEAAAEEASAVADDERWRLRLALALFELSARVLATSGDRTREQLANGMDALYATPLKEPIRPATRRALRRLALM